MAKVTVDGVEVEVPQGTTVLRAAKQAGADVPVFCYHPGLTIPANCRMCLVDIEKSPKPLPACYTEVADGMVVRTQTDKVKATQAAVLEFILLNHPVDCPVCDQAGECVLQEHYITYSAQPSRLMHDKVGKPKAKILGPTVILDAERCIVCTRCVRFCEEVSKSNELVVESRGEHSEITTPQGVELNNPYSLNVVDICPVGALTSRSFRFQRRVWFLDMKDSVCTGCARGCSVRVDSSKNKVERLVPRYNPDVNKYWMCDDGRESLHGRRDKALTMGVVPGPNDTTREAPAADGLRAIAGWLRESAEGTGIALSASTTNEAAYAWARLAKALGAKLYVLKRAPWQGDDVLRQADRDANDKGVRAILTALAPGFGDEAQLIKDSETLDTLLVVDNEIAATPELVEAVAQVANVAVLTDLASALSEAATVVVPLTPLHAQEGTVTNAFGWVQRLGAPFKQAVTTVTATFAAAHLAQAVPSVAEAGQDPELGEKTRAADVFARLAQAVPAFSGLTYAELADHGRGMPVDGQLAPARAHISGTPEWEPDPVSPTYKRPFHLRRGT